MNKERLVFEVAGGVTTPKEGRELVSGVDHSSALNLISSSESSSSCRLQSASAESYISSRGDFHMMSAGSIASEPYARKKRV